MPRGDIYVINKCMMVLRNRYLQKMYMLQCNVEYRSDIIRLHMHVKNVSKKGCIFQNAGCIGKWPMTLTLQQIFTKV